MVFLFNTEEVDICIIFRKYFQVARFLFKKDNDNGNWLFFPWSFKALLLELHVLNLIQVKTEDDVKFNLKDLLIYMKSVGVKYDTNIDTSSCAHRLILNSRKWTILWEIVLYTVGFLNILPFGYFKKTKLHLICAKKLG